MDRKIFRKRLKAFNLIEILVVLAIIGILILVALPNHTSTISKAKAVEAKTQLQHLHSLQKMYFFENSKYSAAMEEVGFEHPTLISDGGTANYTIEIKDAGLTTFKATATAIVDFDGDGVFNVWEIDHDKKLKETIKD